MTALDETLMSLLPLVLRREQGAVTALVREVVPLFRREAGRLLGRERGALQGALRGDVADLVQHALLALWTEEFRPLTCWRADGGRSLVQYLRIFARLRMAALLRGRRRAAASAELLRSETWSEPPRSWSPERRDLLLRVLRWAEANLSGTDVLILQGLLEDADPEPLAERLGLSLGGLYQRKHRLLRRLREAHGADSRARGAVEAYYCVVMPDKNADLHGNVPDHAEVALLILDMINDMQFPGGELLFEHALPMARRLADLKQRARSAGIPVIYVNDNFGRWRSDRALLLSHCVERGRRGAPIVELLRPDEQDYFVLKPKHSGFYCTTLDVLLDYLRARTLIITGVAGNICVLFTANDAYLRDFHLYVPADCTASNDPRDNDYALGQMRALLKADTTPSTELDLRRLVHAGNKGA